jgi:hydrogenase maturation protease
VSIAPVLVVGYGNPGRGDDALGPELVARLEALRTLRPAWPEVEFLTDFQLAPEHAVDLQGRALVLFVDACHAGWRPVTLRRARARRDATFTSHAMSPEALLDACREAFGEPLPEAYVLEIAGACFDAGAALSSAARDRLDAAVGLADDLLSGYRAAA